MLKFGVLAYLKHLYFVWKFQVNRTSRFAVRRGNPSNFVIADKKWKKMTATGKMWQVLQVLQGRMVFNIRAAREPERLSLASEFTVSLSRYFFSD